MGPHHTFFRWLDSVSPWGFSDLMPWFWRLYKNSTAWAYRYLHMCPPFTGACVDSGFCYHKTTSFWTWLSASTPARIRIVVLEPEHQQDHPGGPMKTQMVGATPGVPSALGLGEVAVWGWYLHFRHICISSFPGLIEDAGLHTWRTKVYKVYAWR